MHFKLKKTIAHVGVLTALLPAAGCVLAADGDMMDPATAPKKGQYAYEGNGAAVRSGFAGTCVLTGFWSRETATPECHPDMFASPAAPAPRAAAPEPAPAAAPEAPADTGYEPPQYEEPVAAAAAPAAAPAEEPVPEFVSEPEPADMVPTPSPDSFPAESGAALLAAPIIFYDEEEGAAKDEDIVGEQRYYEEEEGAVKDEDITGHTVYSDEEEGVAQDDGIVSRNEYYEEEEGMARDDDIVSQSRYYEEEEGAAKDEDITGHSVYHDEEEGVAQDDGIIGQSIYHDEEEGVAQDDGIIGQSIYHDEEEGGVADDGITAQNQFGDDDSGREPEDLMSQPQTFADEEPAPEPEAAAPAPETEAAAAAPETEAAAAAPETEAAPAPEPPAQTAQAEDEARPVTMLPVTITVEADPLFDFDKYSVRADSRRKLDDLVGQLQGVTFGEIVVVGFADPIGSPMYNQKLSERRAASVKRYLASKGIPADKIQAEGRGETEEHASFESCGGLRKQKLIACLQPDRRVEVTVTAEKQQ
jgi:OmpA-OmpF porin, OOP family